MRLISLNSISENADIVWAVFQTFQCVYRTENAFLRCFWGTFQNLGLEEVGVKLDKRGAIEVLIHTSHFYLSEEGSLLSDFSLLRS